MSDNSRIFKNTLFLALRMVLSMGIGLYTSRVVLEELGVTDFGIYSVVYGLALIMSFFSSSLTSAIQRFMSVELGINKDADMQHIFSASLVCVVSVALLFILLGETVGMWYLNNELEVPADRLADARTVFQMTIAIVVIEMFRVPYNSMIIAYERMSFYAYISIIETSLKLGVAVALMLLPGDKLLIYVGILVGISVFINALYVYYTLTRVSRVRFSLNCDLKKVVEIGKFSGWNILTSIADLSWQQGSTLILNKFFGINYNATMGVANQVKSAVTAFSKSVQTAANPPMMKTFAGGEYTEFELLFSRISRISFYTIFFLGLPLMINTPLVLDVWLVDQPPMAVVFVRLIILFCIFDSLTGTLWTAMQASGKIAVVQTVISIMWIMCLPLIYFGYKAGFEPYWLGWVLVIINVSALFVRVYFADRFKVVTARFYLTSIVRRVVWVTIAGSVLPLALSALPLSEAAMFFLSTGVSVITVPAAVYLIGISKEEREYVKELVVKFKNRKKS